MMLHLALLSAAVASCLASDGAVWRKEQEDESCAEKDPDTMLLHDSETLLAGCTAHGQQQVHAHTHTLMLQTHLGLSQEGSVTQHASRRDMEDPLMAFESSSTYVNVSELPSGAISVPSSNGRFNIEMPILQRFSVLPNVHNSCSDATGGGVCPAKIAFLFEITSGLTQLEAWEAFFANAPPEKYSIYVELKNQSATLPLQSYGAIAAESVDTDWCALFGGMAALMHAAYADASNAHFVLMSSDSIPVKGFHHIYQFLAEDAPDSSKFCLFQSLDEDGYCCGLVDQLHEQVPLFRKAHQWSVLTREHAALVLTHAASIYPGFVELREKPGAAGCSDEYMVLSSLRNALGAGAESWPEPEMEKKWKVANQCTMMAVWPGDQQCMTPALPSGAGIPPLSRGMSPYISEGPFCYLDDFGAIDYCLPWKLDPFTWEKLHLEHLQSMACSEYLFVRKIPQDLVLTAGTSSQTLNLTKELMLLWDLHANGSLAC